MTQKIVVVGAGKIGALIATLLDSCGDYAVTIIDKDFHIADSRRLAKLEKVKKHTLDINQEQALITFCQTEQFAAMISCLPYFCNQSLATVAAQVDCVYLDLTEDVATTNAIKTLAKRATKPMIPQCGLAPGFVGIAANSLIAKFDEVDTVKLRVGALPEHVSNALQYYLTWSTDGLINEYANPCIALEQGEIVSLSPLQNLEIMRIDGISFEAFNTSGGLGSLAELFVGKVQTMNYKTIRYPGHCEKMRLLMHDLRLQNDRETLKRVLENAIPKTYQDSVTVYVSVTGVQGGNLFEENFSTKIFPQALGDFSWSAIQMTTAASACAVMDIVLHDLQRYQHFVYQEMIPLDVFLANRFGQYYLSHKDN